MMQEWRIDREMRLFSRDLWTIHSTFPIAIGAPETPTPDGVFYIHSKIKNPQTKWKDAKDIGARCLKLGKYDGDIIRPIGHDDAGRLVCVEDGETCYAIHGTDEKESIGEAVSKGCVRLRNEDIIRLFEWVNVGDRVIIV